MTLASSRLLFVASLALAVAACQTEDKPSQPGFTSYASDAGTAVAAPSAKATSNRYFIEFRSRYAYTYGHSLVIFGRLNQAGQMVNPEVAGLAPKSDDPSVYVLGHVAPVPASTGWTDGDLEDVYRSASWRVMLTEAEYRKVVAKHTKAAGQFSALARVALQLQRLRSGHREVHGVQDPRCLAPAATIHNQASRDE